jgi:O-acetyl-ADP-ribose deacetylase (regulator of RNase III)
VSRCAASKLRQATEIALKVVREFLEVHKNRAKTIRQIFVVFLEMDAKGYTELMPKGFPIGGRGRSGGGVGDRNE